MDYFCEMLFLGIDSVIFGICLKSFMRTRNAVKTVDSLSLHDIGPDLQELVKSQEDQRIPYIAIRGIAKALGTPLRSVNSPVVYGVVQRLSVKEHVVARSTPGIWSDQERAIQEVYNYVPFVLRSKNIQVEVLDPLNADVLDLETIADRFEPSHSSVLDYIWGFLTGVRQRGLQTTEEILREGVMLTGIGELKTVEGMGSLRLQPPSDGSPYYITVLPIPSLVHRLQEQQKNYAYLTLIFGGLAVLIGFLMGRRWWRDRSRRSQEEERRRYMEETRRIRRSLVRDKDLPEFHLCVVCRQNPREIIILPCGHVCLCEDCSDGITDNCPICRSRIEKKAAAYL